MLYPPIFTLHRSHLQDSSLRFRALHSDDDALTPIIRQRKILVLAKQLVKQSHGLQMALDYKLLIFPQHIRYSNWTLLALHSPDRTGLFGGGEGARGSPSLSYPVVGRNGEQN